MGNSAMRRLVSHPGGSNKTISCFIQEKPSYVLGGRATSGSFAILQLTSAFYLRSLISGQSLSVFSISENWGPFLESPGNLQGPISVFGDKCLLAEANFC